MESAMNAISACVGAADLREYLLGRMSEPTAAAVETHVASCPECRKLLPTIWAEDDFVADFRDQAGRPQPKNALLDRLAGDLYGLLRSLPTDRNVTPPAAAEATPAPGGLTAENAEDVRSLLAPPREPDELGRLGEYRVLKVLGSGGMGVVFLAEDTRLRRRVALKAMKPALAANAQARQRFLREAQLTASLTHDHVVAVHQVGEEKGVPFLAMPLVQGESLDARLKREGRLPLAEVLHIGRETAEGLAAAHEHGLIHRDVKPANLWLETLPGGRTRVKVLDFGLARAGDGDGEHLTQTGVVVGTPAYMAPEQARGEKVDARSDLFSLGCVLYKLCTGQTPFVGDTAMAVLTALATVHPKPVSDLNPDVPAELSELVMRLLEKNPGRRPASAGEVAQALQGQEMGLARKNESREQTETSCAAPRRRLILGVAALALLAGSIGAGAALIRIQTGQGDYVIDTDDPDFSFRVHDGAVALQDHKINKTYTLTVVRADKGSGEFDLEVNDGGDLSFRKKTFTIRRGEKVALNAWFERKQAAGPTELPHHVDDAWVRQVTALATEQQGEAVAAKLKERNPGPDPWVQATIGRDGVTELRFSAAKVTDISPVALPGLKKLECYGGGFAGGGFPDGKGSLSDLSPLKGLSLTYLTCWNSQVSDLSPLQGMPLEFLDCTGAKVSDLSPLKGMPLWGLHCGSTPVSDLSPLKDLKLTELWCGGTPVSDLSPLRGIKLKTLHFSETGVADLSPLRGMPLTGLYFDITPVSDLSALKDMKLTDLWFQKTKVADLSPLKGMPLTELRFYDTRVSDLSPLKGMPLTTLVFNGTRVSDLSPLKGMPLKDLSFDFKPERDAEILRSIKTLEKINGKPAAEFWKDVDGKKP